MDKCRLGLEDIEDGDVTTGDNRVGEWDGVGRFWCRSYSPSGGPLGRGGVGCVFYFWHTFKFVVMEMISNML